MCLHPFGDRGTTRSNRGESFLFISKVPCPNARVSLVKGLDAYCMELGMYHLCLTKVQQGFSVRVEATPASLDCLMSSMTFE